MKKNDTHPQVDAFLSKAKTWREEMEKLRSILLNSELTEDMKWGKPCYTVQDKNVVLIIPFKESCALLFSKGALLKDKKGLLIQPTENSQSARQIRFTKLSEIVASESLLKAYVKEAIEVEKAGLEVTYKKTSEYSIPEEFQTKLDEMHTLKKAFEALTPGRQRAYLLHFSGAKQSATRASRVEKCMPLILAGKGLMDP
ncbi:MAG: YdeI family protein [Verrucomicrobium sp.]|nr:DUF1801 domain-containing protein [Verrucomicrobium sp.]